MSLEKLQEKLNNLSEETKSFISNLKNRSDSITEFNEELFNIMINKAVVHRDKSSAFIFNSGYKVKVETRK